MPISDIVSVCPHVIFPQCGWVFFSSVDDVVSFRNTSSGIYSNQVPLYRLESPLYREGGLLYRLRGLLCGQMTSCTYEGSPTSAIVSCVGKGGILYLIGVLRCFSRLDFIGRPSVFVRRSLYQPGGLLTNTAGHT